MVTSHNTLFPSALRQFAERLTKTFTLPSAFGPEDQLKSEVKTLLEGAGQALNGMVVNVATEMTGAVPGGRPDVGIFVGGLLTGYIELKAPGKGANPKHFKGDDKKQWEKFKNIPNLVYTDGNEWALYHNGEQKGKLIRLAGNVTRDGAAAPSDDNAAALLELFREFLRWEPITPTTPQALAEMLAPLCRLLRDDVQSALGVPSSNMNSLANDWRAFFFPDADDQQFADAYAQTLTYALLLARLAGATDLSVPQASRRLRVGHRLLADVLRHMGDENAREEIKVPADLLERVISAIDPAIFAQKKETDPWLYFYEDFLAAYDPKMRNDRGVYYTPVEVVQCQVRLVAELLETRFDAEYSFVDDQVVTLDPATGTGTYILAAVQHGLDKIADARGPGARVSAATTAAKNMHAFELLVGPYAVAHLRLTQQIVAEGGTLPPDGVHVYLTDALESPNAAPPGYLPTFYKPLAEEHQRALKIKKETPVLVCIGNPPYDRQTIDPDAQGVKRKGGWVRHGEETQNKTRSALLDDFLAPLSDAGQGVHAKNLYNDYVYFWRWALWKVFEQQPGYGIVSFITASSYLRGPGFAGMRKVMRETFDELWIIDLEGDNLGARKNENVFAIRTPVAIAVGVRAAAQQTTTPATVRYTRLVGTAEEKLAALAAVHCFADLPWQECSSDWLAPFLPLAEEAYARWPRLTDLFPWQANGMQFKRSWPIGESREVLERRWTALLSAKDRRAAFKESRDRVISKQYPSLEDPETRLAPLANLKIDVPVPPIKRIAFRSFDQQWALIDNRVGDYLRPTLHQTHSNHQIYLTSLLTKVLGEGPAAVATALIPDLDHFCNRGGRDVIPLWRDAAATEPNIAHGALERLAAVYGQPVAPEDFFAYCYALLATPAYVTQFWEALTTPGPRMPITRDAALFAKVAAMGRTLIWLHTYGERFVPSGKKAGRVPSGTARIAVGTPTSADEYPESFTYNAETQELHVGKGVFAHVRPEIWNFSVSGLQVVKSWLGYRMKKRRAQFVVARRYPARHMAVRRRVALSAVGAGRDG